MQTLVNKLVLSGLILLLPAALLAQLSIVRKTEIPLQASTTQVVSIPADSTGVLLVQHLKITKPAEAYRVQLRSLNRDFEKSWQFEVPVEKKLQLVQYQRHGRSVYLVYSHESLDFLKVLQVNLENGSHQMHRFYSFEGIHYYQMGILRNNLYLVGAKSSRSLLFRLDLEAGSNQLLPTELKTRMPTVIKNIETDEQRGILQATLVADEPNSQLAEVRIFDHSGEKLVELPIKLEKKYRVLEAKTIVLPDARLMVAGTFSDYEENLPQGIFSFREEEGQKTNYHLFEDMPKISARANEVLGRQDIGDKKSMVKYSKRKTPGLQFFVGINHIFADQGQIMLVLENYDLVQDKRSQQVPFYDPGHNMDDLWSVNNLHLINTNMEYFTERISATAAYDLKFASIVSLGHNGKLYFEDVLELADGITSKQYQRLRVEKRGHEMALLDNFSGNLYRFELQNGQSHHMQNNFLLDKDGNNTGGQFLQATRWFSNHYLNIGISSVTSPEDSKRQDHKLLLCLTREPASY